MHATERTNFIKESESLSKIAEKVTWDVAIRLVQNHSQLCFARGEILICLKGSDHR